jgi:hypothetical protein
MRYFDDVQSARIIAKRVRDWKKLEMIAQEYRCLFAGINISISFYNQIDVERICDRSNDHDTHVTADVWQKYTCFSKNA